MPTVAYDLSLQATRSRLLADMVVAITGASSGSVPRQPASSPARAPRCPRGEVRGPTGRAARRVSDGGAEASYVVSNVTSASDTQCLIDQAIARHGRLDGAVNNAGISQRDEAMADVSDETFDRLVTVNLKGIWLAMRAEINAMLAAGTSGAIVNPSSVGGLRGGAGLSADAATKHALIGLAAPPRAITGPTGCGSTRSPPGPPIRR